MNFTKELLSTSSSKEEEILGSYFEIHQEKKIPP
tara:strand:- start:968 stop:1069 length:102 start_codon:yes stop_codon:yes gene_type:complete